MGSMMARPVPSISPGLEDMSGVLSLTSSEIRALGLAPPANIVETKPSRRETSIEKVNLHRFPIGHYISFTLCCNHGFYPPPSERHCQRHLVLQSVVEGIMEGLGQAD